MINKVVEKQIGHNMKAYVDDILVKSMTEDYHLVDLEETFTTMNKINIKMNPKKSYFGLDGGKFLGFMVSIWGIEIHPSSSKSILDIQPLWNLKELQSLIGKLAALNRFIAKFGEICLPFFKAMCKAACFEWTTECADVFEKVKQYLANSSCLTRPTANDSLLLYLAVAEHVVSAALVQEEGPQQQLVYFVSHVLRNAETKYSPIEKMTYALVIAARKLRPYFQAHPIRVLIRVPLKKALSNYNASERFLGWALEHSEFDITFYPRTTIKSQVLADFITEYSGSPDKWDEKWELYVDGASSMVGIAAEVTLRGPKGEVLHYAPHLLFSVTNNMAEYEAMITWLRIAKEARAREVNLFNDSQLVVKKINEEACVLDSRLACNKDHLATLTTEFEKVQIQHVPRNKKYPSWCIFQIGSIKKPRRKKTHYSDGSPSF
jgi:ribonuclease HI